VRQELYGLLLAHFAISSMHQAALGSDIAPRDPPEVATLGRYSPRGEEKDFIAPSLRRFLKNVSG